MPFLDSLPPLVTLLLLVAILSVAIEVGYQAGRHMAGERDLNKHPVESAVTAAMLGLLAFMLAFTFGASANRYVKMRGVALAEANTAGTLYLRAGFLPPEEADRVRALTREYVQTRVEAIRKVRTEGREQFVAAIIRSGEIQNELWDLGLAAQRRSDTASTGLLLSCINELIDLDAERQAAAFDNRLPLPIWITLCLITALGICMLGVSSGLHGRRSRLATTALIVAFSIVFVLIIDLDRPIRMIFQGGQTAAERALQSMTPPGR